MKNFNDWIDNFKLGNGFNDKTYFGTIPEYEITIPGKMADIHIGLSNIEISNSEIINFDIAAITMTDENLSRQMDSKEHRHYYNIIWEEIFKTHNEKIIEGNEDILEAR